MIAGRLACEGSNRQMSASVRPTPEIVCERTKFVPFDDRFLTDTYVSWLNDPRVVRFSEQRHRHHTRETCRAYWKSFEGSPHHFWAVVLRDDGRHIGNVTATVDLANRVGEISIMLGETDLWGHGYGAEAWKAACQFLLHKAGMRKVEAGTMATNAGMLGIMRKAGMVEEGRRLRHFLWEGQTVDLVQVALFANNSD